MDTAIKIENTVNKDSPLPIYYQIQEIIRELVRSGKLKAGDKIPTEEELCQTFNISRMTVRQALEDLVVNGILVRHKGKGTFVTSNRYVFELSSLNSFSEDMKQRGFRVISRVIEKSVMEPDNTIASNLQIKAGAKIFRIKRLRLVNNDPLAIEINHIPLDRCPGIADDDLETSSLFDILENKYRIRLRYSKQILEPLAAKKEHSTLLEIRTGEPIMKMTGINYSDKTVPIDYIIGIYRGDKYKFKLTLKRQTPLKQN